METDVWDNEILISEGCACDRPYTKKLSHFWIHTACRCLIWLARSFSGLDSAVSKIMMYTKANGMLDTIPVLIFLRY